MSQAAADVDVDRDEPGLAGELLVVLQAARLVMRDQTWLRRAAEAFGITLDDVEDARDRLGPRPLAAFVPPRPGLRPSSVSAAPPVAPVAPVASALKRPPTRERPRRDGQLWCRRHDGGRGTWLPEGRFGLRADRPGRRKPWCVECTAAYAAGKYLSTATLAKLQTEGVLVSTLPPGCPLVAEPCPACLAGFLPTDTILMGEPRVFHKSCLRDG